jgi:biopolymer transport protein ExbD
MRLRKRARDTEVELNITAFLNLMVVLIPFLLLNAVFAQVSVLQLNLPSSEAAPPSDPDDKKPLVLEVLVYSNRYEVVDRQSGPLKIIENKASGEHDKEALREFLTKVKKQFPDISDVTILCEDDTDYELLIHTMDTVRYYNELVNGTNIKRNLFPDIGIGDAPPDSSAAASDTGGAS